MSSQSPSQSSMFKLQQSSDKISRVHNGQVTRLECRLFNIYVFVQLIFTYMIFLKVQYLVTTRVHLAQCARFHQMMILGNHSKKKIRKKSIKIISKCLTPPLIQYLNSNILYTKQILEDLLSSTVCSNPIQPCLCILDS